MTSSRKARSHECHNPITRRPITLPHHTRASMQYEGFSQLQVHDDGMVVMSISQIQDLIAEAAMKKDLVQSIINSLL